MNILNVLYYICSFTDIVFMVAFLWFIFAYIKTHKSVFKIISLIVLLIYIISYVFYNLLWYFSVNSFDLISFLVSIINYYTLPVVIYLISVILVKQVEEKR